MNLLPAGSAWLLSSVLLCASACRASPDAPVAETQPGKQYYVFGAVAQQGGQAFDGDVTIFEAVTKAQPRKDSANLGRVRLIHTDPVHPFETTIDLQHVIDTGDSTYNVHVQEHDVIVVPGVEPKR
jgi:protein involved in polysaccharide export with SLBB domain